MILTRSFDWVCFMTSKIAINVAMSGLPTPTCKLFADGSDTVVETVTLAEETNRKGWYSGTTTTTATGLYFVLFYTDTTPIGSQWIRLTNRSPVEDIASEERFNAVVRASLPATFDTDTLSDGLHLSYADIYREVGRFMGHGTVQAEWTDEQEQEVVDAVRSGLRAFYWPSIDGERYTWSFLRKAATITTAAGTGEYALASDFTGSLLSFTHAEGQDRHLISRVPEEEIRALRSADAATGVPEYCAVVAVQPGAGEKTTYQSLLYPIPDGEYVLHYRYAIDPALSGTDVYHLGGSVHSEAVLESCLAAAEKLLRPELGPGVHAAKFQEALRASLAIDRELQ